MMASLLWQKAIMLIVLFGGTPGTQVGWIALSRKVTQVMSCRGFGIFFPGK